MGETDGLSTIERRASSHHIRQKINPKSQKKKKKNKRTKKNTTFNQVNTVTGLASARRFSLRAFRVAAAPIAAYLR